MNDGHTHSLTTISLRPSSQRVQWLDFIIRRRGGRYCCDVVFLAPKFDDLMGGSKSGAVVLLPKNTRSITTPQ